MARSPPFASICVVQNLEGPELSNAQKTFNTLIDKIGKQRAALASWEDAVQLFQNRYQTEWQPLIEQTARLRREWLFGLEKAYASNALGKSDRQWLAALIREWAGEYFAEQGDTEMKAIYQRFGGEFDQEAVAACAGLEAILGDLDMNDPDANDPDVFVEQMQARLDAEEAAREAARQSARAQRKKSAKQTAREDALRATAEQGFQSMRAVYRKLVSALHPDRESDPEESLRKTALMQQVNLAYDKKDLLALLELQLKIEHLDQVAINNLGEERLAHFNKILREQLRELEGQVSQVSRQAMLNLGIDAFKPLSPSRLMREFDSHVDAARHSLQAARFDLKAARDVMTLKAWLKQMRRYR